MPEVDGSQNGNGGRDPSATSGGGLGRADAEFLHRVGL